MDYTYLVGIGTGSFSRVARMVAGSTPKVALMNTEGKEDGGGLLYCNGALWNPNISYPYLQNAIATSLPNMVSAGAI